MRFPIPQRINAFTLLELVVVLVVSAVLFRLAYAALGLVQRQQAVYERHSATLGQVSSWQQALANDLRRASRVELMADELRCQLPIGPVVYAWRDSALIRQQGEVLDTLEIPVRAGAYFWQGQPRSRGLVDEVSYLLAARDTFYLQATAHYAAEQMLGDSLPSTSP